VTGGEGTAREAIHLLRAVFGWAVREKIVATNPAEHVRVGGSGTREIILDDTAAYERLFEHWTLWSARSVSATPSPTRSA
jgi:hypothetical protein